MKFLSLLIFVLSSSVYASINLNDSIVKVGNIGNIAEQNVSLELIRTGSTPEKVDVIVSFEQLVKYCKVRENHSKRQFVCLKWARKLVKVTDETVTLDFKKAQILQADKSELIQITFLNGKWNAEVKGTINSEYKYEVKNGFFNSFKLIFVSVE